MGDPESIDLRIREHVESCLGLRIVTHTVPETGQTKAKRYILSFEDGSGAFVKAAVDEQTENWLRVEHRALSIAELDVVPEIVSWLPSDENRSILITEDLSQAHWPANHWPVQW